jgi:site-specific DNA recombinase
MPSNDHRPRRAILYARVSTDEQARSGYSLAQQLEALRNYAAREGYEIFEEVSDPGQSGASLERPGMDRVRDLVAAGGVSVVLAQDRDRFAREPAYHYLLRREFEEYGTKIRALNDRGDESPEGELTDGILDQLAKFERAKTAERTRRGKLRKAREGKVVAGSRPPYGFHYNDARDNYVVDEESMRTVERIFRMVGGEGHTMHAVRLAFNKEGIRSPLGGRFWTPKAIRDRINDDVYRPHTYDEIRVLVSPEVALRLDPKKHYGIWWFNRRRYETKQVSEAGPDGERRYRRLTKLSDKPCSEWIAVPVPDPGVPRELVDAAREAIEKNTRPSANGERYWELSGGILYCGECGRRMTGHTTVDPKGRGRGRYFYYRCPRGGRRNEERPCSHGKNHRAEETEAAVWGLVSRLLKDPERLRAGLEELIEQERAAMRVDPEREAKAWIEKLSEIDQERRGFLRLAAKGHIADDELAEELAALDETRATAERELETLQGRRKVIEKLERDRDALLEYYAGMMPEALGKLTGEERRQVYGMLRLRVKVSSDGSMEATGILRDNLHILYEDDPDIEGNHLCENELVSPYTTFAGCTA